MNKKNCQNVNVYNAVLEGSCIYYIRKILQNGDVVCTTFQAKITKKKILVLVTLFYFYFFVIMDYHLFFIYVNGQFFCKLKYFS